LSRILGLWTFPGDLVRLARISWTVSRIVRVALARWARVRIVAPTIARFAPGRAAAAVPEIDLPARVREALERLGPTFVKLGQILSVRPDILPPPYLAEFEKLRSKVPPFSYGEVRQIVAAELKRPLESVFREFEPTPLAAASIAQVHCAVLPTGEKVAVKVQRPGVRRQMREDIRIVRWLARRVERLVPSARPLRPIALVNEFADWTMKELDFRVEAEHADHFRHNFANDPSAYVPRIYWDLTSARLLTMEFTQGAHIDNPEEMAQFGIDRMELARHAVQALFKEVFLHGFFHGDPHPGNFVALRGNTICYYDFGIVGHLTSDLRRELTSFFLALTRGDIEASVAHLAHLATPLDGADPERFERDLLDLVGAWHYSRRISLARTFLNVLRTGAARGMAFPSALALLGKALMTVETVGYTLYPEFSLDEEFRPFVGEMVKQSLSLDRVRAAVESNVLDYAHAIQEIPRRYARILDQLALGRVSIQLDRSELDALRSELNRQTAPRVLVPLVIVLVAASAYLFGLTKTTHVAGIPTGWIYLAGAAIFGLWLMVSTRRR
jgi:ubiquinone biosynthesis protein